MRERAREVLRRDVDVRDGLALHRRDVGRERHRRLADVLAARERFLRLLGAAVDDDELVRGGREARAAADLDETLGLEEIHDLVGHALDAEAQRARELGHRHLAAQIERLQREVGEEAERQTGLLDGLRLGGQRDGRHFRVHRGARGGRRHRSCLRLRLVQVRSEPLPECLTEHSVEGRLVYHFDTELICFFELAARAGSRDEQIRFRAD